MIIGNRFLRILLCTVGVFVIVINVIYWANQPLVFSPFYYINHNDFVVIQTHRADFIGFSRVFDFLETFPGLTTTIVSIRTYSDIVSNFEMTGIGLLDGVIAIFRLLTTPIVLSMTILVDLFRNIAWFIRLLAGNF